MQRLELIQEAIAKGTSYAEIGLRFKVSRQRIQQIAKKHNLGGGLAASRSRTEAFKTSISLGFSPKKAARAFGYSEKTALALAKQFRAAKRRKKLKPLMEKVLAGASYRSAAGGNPALAQRLRYHCLKSGIKSKAGSRWSDFSARRQIVLSGRSSGLTWRAIAEEVSREEGQTLRAGVLYKWAQRRRNSQS